jgi:hypothetical protein
MIKGGGDNTTLKQNLQSKSRNVGRREEEEKEEECVCRDRGRAQKRRRRNEQRKKEGEKKKKRARIIIFLAKHVFLAKSELKKIQVLMESFNYEHCFTVFHYLKIV